MADGVEDVSDAFDGGWDEIDVFLSMSRMCLRPPGWVRLRKTLLRRSAEWSNLPVCCIAIGVTCVELSPPQVSPILSMLKLTSKSMGLISCWVSVLD